MSRDARTRAKTGAQALVVSNKARPQLDGAPSSIEGAAGGPSTRSGSQIEVMFDGRHPGPRKDVMRALRVGAKSLHDRTGLINGLALRRATGRQAIDRIATSLSVTMGPVRRPPPIAEIDDHVMAI